MSWENNLKAYDAIVEGISDFERKGKSMPYTSSNGYMFSLLNKAGELGIRLPKEDQKKFIEQYPDSGPLKSHGATMRDYVLVPEALLKEPDVVAEWLKKGFAYVNTLPPK
ncbi:MAG: TfoX/Sxy family protein [Bacteroidetes bacterium]|nr:TfoX/Sxy family protein [Bacteroidota bacterium]